MEKATKSQINYLIDLISRLEAAGNTGNPEIKALLDRANGRAFGIHFISLSKSEASRLIDLAKSLNSPARGYRSPHACEPIYDLSPLDPQRQIIGFFK